MEVLNIKLAQNITFDIEARVEASGCCMCSRSQYIHIYNSYEVWVAVEQGGLSLSR